MMREKTKGDRVYAVCCFCIVILCSLLWPMTAAAEARVTSTAEAAGDGDSIYVAGNPDWYPVEYYNAETKSFEGILPEILKIVSEKTGRSFTYLRAGEGDQRLRMAQDGQVEMVSGCDGSEEQWKESPLTMGRTILTIPGEEGDLQVCFVFTNIAEEELVTEISEALQAIPAEELTGIAVGAVMENAEMPRPWWYTAIWGGVFALLLAAVIFLEVQLRRQKKDKFLKENFDLEMGIGNRSYFYWFFDEQISDEYRGIYSAVFIGFDIVRVNRYYGEAVAEEQLRFAAEELSAVIGINEAVARVSGGGFLVLRPSSSEREAEEWTGRILAQLNQYTEQYEKSYQPEFHAGIYMMATDDKDGLTVLNNAQRGYQRAMEGNREYVLIQPETLHREKEDLKLKKEVLRAIENGEFKMFLQFIVNTDTGRIVGAESLSRWDRPRRGLLYPGSYIDLMETEKTVSDLDFFIFEEACKQVEEWQKAGYRDLKLSCNFTRITIDREDFAMRIEEIADRYDCNRSRIVLEITEDIMEEQKDAAFDNINRCKEMGFLIALDDVGSGHTSFADLRDYPIDIMKIDRGILNAAVNLQGIALLRGIIALGHSLQMQVLCEGIETESQRQLMSQLGCDYLQGYYFYRALPKEEANRWLAENGR